MIPISEKQARNGVLKMMDMVDNCETSQEVMLLINYKEILVYQMMKLKMYSRLRIFLSFISKAHTRILMNILKEKR